MEYIKGEPYFCSCVDKIKQYPYLKTNISCEILIIGGGIDGAIANYYLSKNYDVVLVDKGRLGFACTCCATALLEYQLDNFAEDLKKSMSEKEIVLAYNMGINSFNEIKNFISKYGNKCNFTPQPTLLFSEVDKHIQQIKNEYNFRKSNGFDCELILEQNNPFPFTLKAGIFCKNGGGSFNPYLFEKQMIENSCNQNKIFENTNITKLIKEPFGYTAITSFGEKITCNKVIIATGFNWEVLDKTDLCQRFISYSIVTNKLNINWHNNALIRNVGSPYNYLRQLPDGRIIFGGEDTEFKQKSINEKMANKKYTSLQKSFIKMFPQEKENLTIDYKFCGAFGTTANNLGIIGESKFNPNLLYFISCGANGIVNAIAGAKIIDDIINKRPNPLINLFSPKRNGI